MEGIQGHKGYIRNAGCHVPALRVWDRLDYLCRKSLKKEKGKREKEKGERRKEKGKSLGIMEQKERESNGFPLFFVRNLLYLSLFYVYSDKTFSSIL